MAKQVKAKRTIAAEATESVEDPPPNDALVDAEESPAPGHGLGHRLAIFAYRGQLGPTIREELKDFLPKWRR